MALRWYVVHAYSNFENKVKQALEERIKRDGLEEFFGKFWSLPKKWSKCVWGSSVKAKENFFLAMCWYKWN